MHRIVSITFIFLVYSAISFSQDSPILVPFLKNEKWGYSDTNGIIKITPKYDTVHFFQSGIAAVYLNGKQGFIEPSGKEIIPPIYDQCRRIHSLYYLIRNENKYGLITKGNILVVEPVYDDIVFLSNNYIRFSHNGMAGVMKLEGASFKQLIEAAYKEIFFISRSNEFEAVKFDSTACYFDETGKIVRTKVFEELKVGDFQKTEIVEMTEFKSESVSIQDDARLIRRGQKYGLMIRVPDADYFSYHFDSIPAIYDSIIFNAYTTDDHPIFAKKGKKWGAVGFDGSVLLPFIYDDVNKSISRIKGYTKKEYLFCVQRKHKWGLISLTETSKDTYSQKELTPFKYDEIHFAAYNNYIVKNKDKYGVVDIKKAKEIIPTQYVSIIPQFWFPDANNVDFGIFQVERPDGKFIFVGQNRVEFYADQSKKSTDY